MNNGDILDIETSAKPRRRGLSFAGALFCGKTARLPIDQGGMGVGQSLSGLAAAVAAEGGIGVIAATASGKIDRITTSARSKRTFGLSERNPQSPDDNNGLIGVNIMVAADGFPKCPDGRRGAC
jgi:NAD(P)H-dependent flavin oxidoreductase YrpB (nitropropane dioxygenase family)